MVTSKKPKTPAHSTQPQRSKTPVFDAMIEEACRTPSGEWISHEELSRELGITDEERAAARARIDRWRQEDAEEEAAGQQASGAVANGRVPKERPSRKAGKAVSR